ncbi:MAG: CpaF family protein [Planctomycetota bacterium]
MTDENANWEELEAARHLFRRSLSKDAGGRMKTTKQRDTGQRDERRRQPSEVTQYLKTKQRLQERLLDHLSRNELLGAGDDIVARSVEAFVDSVLEAEELPLNEGERGRLSEELLEEALGMGPLAGLMADPAVTDILVNRHDQIYVERFGRLELSDVRFRDAEHVQRIIERLAMRCGRRIDQAWPMADLRLPDGSRVNATIPPISIDGPTISIRRFGRRRISRADLVRMGAMSQDMSDFLDVAVLAKRNILISGGTGVGKSTMLGAIAEAIPNHERVLTIEDTAELILDQEHVVRLETRPANVEGQGTILARDLVINSLRMRPDRIILGEVRSSEALDMLQAMNTGHEGGMCTVHSNTPRDALSRLETMTLLAGSDLPSRAIREQIASAIHLIVQLRRMEDGVRRIERITELTGMEDNTPLLQDIFVFERRGRAGKKIEGEYQPTGIVPRFVEEMRERGHQLDAEIFRRSSGPRFRPGTTGAGAGDVG